MYLTFTVYALLVALFIWGGKFAGFKKENFHEDSASLDSFMSLRGFAAIGVILHHISQEQAFQMANHYGTKPGELSIFVNAGYLFVAIFFFCSGFGLIKSLETKPDYFNGFMKKRVVKTLVIPYYVSILIYGILRFATGERFAPVQWVTHILGFTMMNEYAWYPIIAAILYTAFYLIFKNIKNRRISYLLMALVIVLLGMIFCVNGHFTWWAGPKNWWLGASPLHEKWWAQQKVFWISGEWWINSCPAFFIGMLFAQFEDQIRSWFKKFYWGKLLLVLVITVAAYMLSGFGQWKFGWWSEFNGNGPDIGKKIATYFCVIPYSMVFPIMIFTIMLKYKVSNPVSRFFGKLSLETYMMNLIAITAFRFLMYKPHPQYGSIPFYKAGHYNLAIYFAAVFALTILLGLLYKFLCGLITKRIK
ncbi:acyltransferase family protein [Treponema bryantii]|uniref:acyltransferase family protein n=1 Tax=Treponema bryantii TaxID=163 RepID=UPI0003B40632|nr:acyltransferase [Treponema bryantii]